MGEAARDQIVREIIEILVVLLETEKVELGDNFFELGGTSLSAMLFIAQVNDCFGIELPFRTLFETTTIGELCENIAQIRELGADGSLAHPF